MRHDSRQPSARSDLSYPDALHVTTVSWNYIEPWNLPKCAFEMAMCFISLTYIMKMIVREITKVFYLVLYAGNHLYDVKSNIMSRANNSIVQVKNIPVLNTIWYLHLSKCKSLRITLFCRAFCCICVPVNGQFHNCASWSFITVHGQF